jgi:hypothetical protein
MSQFQIFVEFMRTLPTAPFRAYVILIRSSLLPRFVSEVAGLAPALLLEPILRPRITTPAL